MNATISINDHQSSRQTAKFGYGDLKCVGLFQNTRAQSNTIPELVTFAWDGAISLPLAWIVRMTELTREHKGHVVLTHHEFLLSHINSYDHVTFAHLSLLIVILPPTHTLTRIYCTSSHLLGCLPCTALFCDSHDCNGHLSSTLQLYIYQHVVSLVVCHVLRASSPPSFDIAP